MIEDLPEELVWTYERCDGYMDLSMWDAAASLLRSVPKAYHNHPRFLRLQERKELHDENWAQAASLSGKLIDQKPDNVQYWISHAYATRRARDITEARAILERAAENFPDDPIVGYNLACYDCVEGKNQEAITRLTEILEHYPDILKLIEEDSDLAAVRDFFDEEG